MRPQAFGWTKDYTQIVYSEKIITMNKCKNCGEDTTQPNFCSMGCYNKLRTRERAEAMLQFKDELYVPERLLFTSSLKLIGKEYQTPKGGILTIKGVHNQKKRRNLNYILHCSICSKDEELWPDGSIYATRAVLDKGGIVCGCGLNPKWTEEQTLLRVKRKTKDRGWKFLGFKGKYKGNVTKVILNNPETNNTWDSFTIDTFLNSNYRDPSLQYKGKYLPEETHIKDFFKTGRFSEGTKFERDLERRNKVGCTPYWWVTCGDCKTKYNSFGSNLKRGAVGCDCYTRDRNNRNGYYPDRAEEQDTLYVYCFDNKYIKVGRTFDMQRRLYHLSTMSGTSRDKITLLYQEQNNHDYIYRLEQDIHEELTERGFYYKEETWSTEIFDRDCEYILMKILK